MKFEPILINGRWIESFHPADSFRAVNPATGAAIEPGYPVSSLEDALEALAAAKQAAVELHRLSVERIAGFLGLFAEKTEARLDDLIRMAALETALPEEPRLRSAEMPRTVSQIRQAAAAVLDRSWCHAVIDTKAGLRSKYNPLAGPVLVFAPNNFPLAFNAAAGGDFISAMASGNPVIGFSNPGHPGTTKLFAGLVLEALLESGLPPASFQLLYRVRFEDGYKIVSHPSTAAVAFTGSRGSGLKLKKAADEAGKPAFLEMSSINPLLILPGALETRLEAVAQDLFASCSLGSGQFCTKPGLVFIQESPSTEKFMNLVTMHFQSASAGYLLGESVLRKAAAVVADLVGNGARLVAGGKIPPGSGYRYENTLLRVPAEIYLAGREVFQQEAFGPVSLMVIVRNADQWTSVLENLDGNLTGCIYSALDGRDDSLYDRIEPLLRRRVGRLLNDKMPTGVAVSPAMAHGGPFPATGHPGFTSVGIPASLLRFTALQSYDHVREHRLPAELRDRNPTGRMWRFIDGEWTRKDVS